MKIKLSKTFASDAKVDEYDVLQMKKVLNRLGYYMPDPKTGIMSISDRAVFDALRAFQKNQGLQVTGRAKPGDLTEAMLNDALSSAPDAYYIWRTVNDGKVRKEHAQYNGLKRLWSESPDPGEDFNCRCWAEAVAQEAIIPEQSASTVHTCYAEQQVYNHAKENFEKWDLRNKKLRAELLELEKEKAILMEGIKEQLLKTPAGMIAMNFPAFKSDFLNVIQEILSNKVQDVLTDKLQELFDSYTKMNKLLEYKKQQASILQAEFLQIRAEFYKSLTNLEMCQKAQ